MRLNRGFPQRPQVLKRLVLVFEQLRDPGKAAAFPKVYNRLATEDPWAAKKIEQFSAGPGVATFNGAGYSKSAPFAVAQTAFKTAIVDEP